MEWNVVDIKMREEIREELVRNAKLRKWVIKKINERKNNYQPPEIEIYYNIDVPNYIIDNQWNFETLGADSLEGLAKILKNREKHLNRMLNDWDENYSLPDNVIIVGIASIVSADNEDSFDKKISDLNKMLNYTRSRALRAKIYEAKIILKKIK